MNSNRTYDFYLIADGVIKNGYDTEQQARSAAAEEVTKRTQQAVIVKRLTTFERTFTTDEPKARP